MHGKLFHFKLVTETYVFDKMKYSTPIANKLFCMLISLVQLLCMSLAKAQKESVLTFACYINISDAPRKFFCDDQEMFLISAPENKQSLQITTELGATVMPDAHCKISGTVQRD